MVCTFGGPAELTKNLGSSVGFFCRKKNWELDLRRRLTLGSVSSQGQLARGAFRTDPKSTAGMEFEELGRMLVVRYCIL